MAEVGHLRGKTSVQFQTKVGFKTENTFETRCGGRIIFSPFRTGYVGINE